MAFRCLASSIILAAVVAAGAAAAPAICLGPEATQIEHAAAMELQRCLYAVSGDLPAIQTLDTVAPGSPAIVLGTPDSLPDTGTEWPFGLEPPEGDGYLLHSLDLANSVIVIGGSIPEGVQNGMYAFLESLGFGFYLGGETMPKTLPDLTTPEGPHFHKSNSPAFEVRGTLPWFNFLNSPTTWEPEDFKAYIDQLARMRCNFVGFHSYDSEPFAAYEWEGRLVGGAPLGNTSKAVWSTEPLAARHFFAGTGRYFAREHFGAASSFVEDSEASIRAAQEVLRDALAYAKSRGLRTCMGFEVSGDPLNAATQQHLEARLKALLEAYPMLDYVWLWEPEGMADNPGDEPLNRSLWDAYAQRWAGAFESIEDPAKRGEAVRMALFALQAHQVLTAVGPDTTLVLSGWGGDEWLHFTDFYPCLDKVLPKDIVFAALDNFRVTPEVSAAYAALSPERQRWPILWFECDGDQWMPQPNLYPTAGACLDALDKGCQGMLGIHWRTRAVEDTATYCARFAWNPKATVEDYYARRALDLFGSERAAWGSDLLIRLEKLGYRWVGGMGQQECGSFTWSVGDEANRVALFRILGEIRAELKPDAGLLRRPFAGIPGADVLLRPIDALLAASGNTPHDLALADLYNRIAYVLAFDRAAAGLVPGGPLDPLIEKGEPEAIVEHIRNSGLADAMHAYAGLIRNKGELGVLATMNCKAWADLRQRSGLDAEALAELEALPERFEKSAAIHVLPDRVIAPTVPKGRLRGEVKARAIGEKTFVEHNLPQLGRTTLALTFPAEIGPAGGIEYGVDVRGGRGKTWSWPAGFPSHAQTALRLPAPPISARPAPAPSSPTPVEVHAEAAPGRYSVRLTWAARPGEQYTVSRGGETLATLSDGWFEDTAPLSGAALNYTVVARNIMTGATATSAVPVWVPELPLPQPPEKVRVSTHGNRIVVGWQSDAPQAAQYYILKFNEKHEVIEETYVDADYGYYLQISDQVALGTPYTYTVAAVTPDGRIGPPSKRIGIISSTEPLKPLVRLSFEDESFLEGLAQLTQNGLALGGRGWAELPPQPEWDPDHALTLSLWVNLDDLEGMPVLLCKGAWQEAGYFLQIYNHQVRFYMAGVDTLDAGRPIPGEWQHIAATFGFNNMRIYLNGKEVGRKRVMGRPRASENALLVGRYAAGDEVYFVRGLLDDVRVYDVPLTPGEVKKLYEKTKPE